MTKDELEIKELQGKIQKLTKECAALDNQHNNEGLEINELKKKITKLDREIENLTFQSSKDYRKQEKLRTYASFFSALIGILAVSFSMWQFSKTSQQSQDMRREDKLTATLNNLIDTSSKKRLLASVALKSFMQKGDDVKNGQALIALINALETETNTTVQNSILYVFRSPEILEVDPAILKNVLLSLIKIDRDLVNEFNDSNYYLKGTTNEEYSPNLIKLDNISKAIISMLSQKIFIKDLSNIYLSNADFSGLDLSNTDFSNSNLAYTKFDSCKCTNCTFNGANLIACSFVKSNLSNSKFMYGVRDSYDQNFIDGVYDLYERAIPYQALIDFRHSILTKAKFFNFPMFLYDNTTKAKNTVTVYTARLKYQADFSNAILDGTDFSNLSVYSINSIDNQHHFNELFPFVYLSSGTKELTKKTNLNRISLDENTELVANTASVGSNIVLSDFSDAFVGTIWRKAKLPKAIQDLFSKNPPPKEQAKDTW